MSEDTEKKPDAAPAKGTKLKWVIILIVLLAAGGGAGFAGYAGLIDLDSLGGSRSAHDGAVPGGDSEFVGLPELIIPLGEGARARHLRAVLHIEVAAGAGERIKMLEPRVVDVLNTFLRAVEERDIESPDNFARIHAQMLRRIRLVVGEQDVRDVLVGEFIMR